MKNLQVLKIIPYNIKQANVFTEENELIYALKKLEIVLTFGVKCFIYSFAKLLLLIL
jgi:hypothetical protein